CPTPTTVPRLAHTEMHMLTLMLPATPHTMSQLINTMATMASPRTTSTTITRTLPLTP
ncbi:hypothetical protein H4S08_004499, partial [Coemansia sp. RSA 1365]